MSHDRPGAEGKPIVNTVSVRPSTIEQQKGSPVTDTDEKTSADQDRLRTLEEMMHASGYVRSSHGFWITPGAETKTETRLAVHYAED